MDFLGCENLRNNETALTIETGKTLFKLGSMDLIKEKFIKSKETELNKKTNELDYYYLNKITGMEASYYYETHNPRKLYSSSIESLTYAIAFFVLHLNLRVESISVLNENYNFDSPVFREVNKLINCEALDRIIEQSELKNKDFLKFFNEFYKPLSVLKQEKSDLKHLNYVIDRYDKIHDSLDPLLHHTITANFWNRWFF